MLLLVDPTLGEYAMLSEAVKVLGKLNENIETMLKKQKKEAKPTAQNSGNPKGK